MAWSEPMFHFFTVVGLSALARHIDDERAVTLIVSSSAIALGCLTRYAGLAVIATGVLSLLLFSRTPFGRRLRTSTMFLIISALPIAVWVTGNVYSTGNATGRVLMYHPVTVEDLQTGGLTVLSWLLPVRGQDLLSRAITFAIVASLLSLTALSWRCRRGTRENSLLNYPSATLMRISMMFLAVYAVFLIVSISLLDANIELGARILSPAYVVALILCLCLAHRVWRSMCGTRGVRAATGVLGAVIVGAYLARGVVTVADLSRDGQGYASRAWKESEIVQKVRALPSGVRVYSNAPRPLAFFAGGGPEWIPRKMNPSSGIADDGYPRKLAEMGRRLETRRAVLVWIDRERRPYLPSEEELRESLSLRLIERVSDGAIYGAGRRATAAPSP